MRTLILLCLLAAPLQAAETTETLRSSDGITLVFIIRSVENPAGAIEVVVVRNGKAGRVIMGGGQPPVPPPDPPADSTLTTFVRGLTVKVKATDKEREQVADIFTRGAAEIRSGRLRGSRAIVTWTTNQLHGPPDAEGARTGRPEWEAWFTALMGHVLRLEALEFPVAEKWAGAWEQIGKGVGP